MGFFSANSFEKNDAGVWISPTHHSFNYSDGKITELYLKKVIGQSKDLSTDSPEFKRYMLNWPTSYHLSHKRAQLLKGFSYDRSDRVLEVGCGCGAITRFLGETFDEVLSIEGSPRRAEIARLRTRDLENVEIVCAPFQEIVFPEPFDIIFCIGVFEYSSAFVGGDDPFRTILDRFKQILKPGGLLVLAIENQFGIKYFSSSPEDHTGVAFDGIEGYHRYGDKARTFGQVELGELLAPFFNNVKTFYPYPDYKMPTCLISEEFSDYADSSLLIGEVCMKGAETRPGLAFNEKFVMEELAKNGLEQFFANSFLIQATDSDVSKMKNDWVGIVFNSGRRQQFRGTTRFIPDKDSGGLYATKSCDLDLDQRRQGGLELVEDATLFQEGASLQLTVEMLVTDRRSGVEDIAEAAKSWYQKLCLVADGQMIDGKFLDALWRNSFSSDDECSFIDLEWVWFEPQPFDIFFTRALYYGFRDLKHLTDIAPHLRRKSIKLLIFETAGLLGRKVGNAEIRKFIEFEAEMQYCAEGVKPVTTKTFLHLVLNSKIGPTLPERLIKLKNIMFAYAAKTVRRIRDNRRT